MFIVLKYKHLTKKSAILSRVKITEIFVSVDDFCQEFEPMLNSKLIDKKKK